MEGRTEVGDPIGVRGQEIREFARRVPTRVQLRRAHTQGLVVDVLLERRANLNYASICNKL